MMKDELLWLAFVVALLAVVVVVVVIVVGLVAGCVSVGGLGSDIASRLLR